MNVTRDLTLIISELTNALEFAKLIQAEYEANGNDSLANIDYGASLNTNLRFARQSFASLDDAGLFTMGEA